MHGDGIVYTVLNINMHVHKIFRVTAFTHAHTHIHTIAHTYTSAHSTEQRNCKHVTLSWKRVVRVLRNLRSFEHLHLNNGYNVLDIMLLEEVCESHKMEALAHVSLNIRHPPTAHLSARIEQQRKWTREKQTKIKVLNEVRTHHLQVTHTFVERDRPARQE